MRRSLEQKSRPHRRRQLRPTPFVLRVSFGSLPFIFGCASLCRLPNVVFTAAAAAFSDRSQVGIVKGARRRGIRSFRPMVNLPYAAKGSHGRPPCSVPRSVAIPVTQGRPQNAPLFARCERYGPFLYAICQYANPILPQIAVPADLSQMSVLSAAPCKRKKGPGIRGHFIQLSNGGAFG
jgi:hypothetical protein